jgi:hypothetical protein
MNCLRPPESWDRGFKSHSRHGCLRLFCVRVGSDLATGWSPVQGVLPIVLELRNWSETKRFTDALCNRREWDRVTIIAIPRFIHISDASDYKGSWTAGVRLLASSSQPVMPFCLLRTKSHLCDKLSFTRHFISFLLGGVKICLLTTSQLHCPWRDPGINLPPVLWKQLLMKMWYQSLKPQFHAAVLRIGETPPSVSPGHALLSYIDEDTLNLLRNLLSPYLHGSIPSTVHRLLTV